MPGFQDYAGSGPITPGGHYRMAFKTGATTTISAAGALFCFRWTQQNLFCRLMRFTVDCTITTAFSAAQKVDVALFRATNWTTAPTAGVTLTNFKNGENAMADSGVTTGMANLAQICPAAASNIAIANTGALTDGSPVIDGNPLAYAAFNLTANTGGVADRRVLYDVAWANEYPLTLGNNEGLELQVVTTQGTAGVLVYYVNMVIAVNNQPF